MIITYKEDEHNVVSLKAIFKSLSDLGVSDSIILLNVSLTIESDTLTEEVADLAVISADGDGLIQSKVDKIKEIEAKSKELTEVGVESWEQGKSVSVSEAEFYKRIAAYQFYTQNPSELSENTPYISSTIEGGIISTSNVQDIDDMSKNIKHRLDYIYFSMVQNPDTSKSEIILRAEVELAQTIEDVDAIIDLRV